MTPEEPAPERDREKKEAPGALHLLRRKLPDPRRAYARFKSRGLARIVLITDPGPDPDTVKMILIAAMLHKHGRIQVLGVVCNGSKQPHLRAKLARCVLNHVGEPDIPVAIGMPGKPVEASAHEFDLEGFRAVDVVQLESGYALLKRVLLDSPPTSVRFVLTSCLRDFAELTASDSALVLAKVHSVYIQGGLSPTSDHPAGWAPDASAVNNSLDIRAARRVYRYCFDNGIPMTVVSRNAVPMLPMQLARSFAERPKCPVMQYLANAQFEALQGLWFKLCAGQLPARCTKGWFFNTFCGLSQSQFMNSDYSKLSGTHDITPHLNGFVKPYDTVTLMAAIPLTARLFRSTGAAAAALVHYGSTTHVLLSRAEHAVEVSHVVNLLRDTYHEVVLATSLTRQGQERLALDQSLRRKRFDSSQLSQRQSGVGVGGGGGGGVGRRPRAGSVGFFSRLMLGSGHIDTRLRGSIGTLSTCQGAAAGALPAAECGVSGAGGLAAPFAGVGAGGGAATDRWTGTGVRAGPLRVDEAVELLREVLDGAHAGNRAFARVSLTVGISLAALMMIVKVVDALLLSRSLGQPASIMDLARTCMLLATSEFELRHACYSLVSVVALVFALITLPPTASSLRLTRALALAILAVACFSLALLCTMAAQEGEARLSPGLWRRLLLCVAQFALLSAQQALALLLRWSRPAALTYAVCAGLGSFLLLDVTQFALGIHDDDRLPAPPPRALQSSRIVVLAFAAPAGLLMLLPATQAWAQASIARLLRTPGQRAGLAPLLGYGSLRGERDPAALCAEAAACYRPRRLEPLLLAQALASSERRQRSLVPGLAAAGAAAGGGAVGSGAAVAGARPEVQPPLLPGSSSGGHLHESAAALRAPQPSAASASAPPCRPSGPAALPPAAEEPPLPEPGASEPLAALLAAAAAAAAAATAGADAGAGGGAGGGLSAPSPAFALGPAAYAALFLRRPSVHGALFSLDAQREAGAGAGGLWRRVLRALGWDWWGHLKERRSRRYRSQTSLQLSAVSSSFHSQANPRAAPTAEPGGGAGGRPDDLDAVRPLGGPTPANSAAPSVRTTTEGQASAAETEAEELPLAGGSPSERRATFGDPELQAQRRRLGSSGRVLPVEQGGGCLSPYACASSSTPTMRLNHSDGEPRTLSPYASTPTMRLKRADGDPGSDAQTPRPLSPSASCNSIARPYTQRADSARGLAKAPSEESARCAAAAQGGGGGGNGIGGAGGGAQGGARLLQRGSSDRERQRRQVGSLPAQHADAFVLHSSADDAIAKGEALWAWARDFERAHGRPPLVWLDTICEEPGLSRVEALERSSLYAAFSCRLLLLAGPTLTASLGAVAELYCWSALGGSLAAIDVELVGSDAATAAETVASFDTFHVMYSTTSLSPESEHLEGGSRRRRDDRLEVVRRLSLATELSTVRRLNAVVRDLLPKVREAEVRASRRVLDGTVTRRSMSILTNVRRVAWT